MMPLTSIPSKPRIALTMGDPCGVGPEIIIRALSSPLILETCSPWVVGDPLPLERAARLLGSNLKMETLFVVDGDGPDVFPSTVPGVIPVVAPARLTEDDIVYGRPTRDTCRAVVQCIQTAVEMAQNGTVHGICTCPIHKANLHRHGFEFPGHTEFIRDLTGADDVIMMLAGPRLRVSLVTIHHALSEVPGLLTRERISRTIQITGDALIRDFGIRSPRIAVAGLNPHAGEEGRFGKEEKTLIEPVILAWHQRDFSLSGPHPPDTLFYRAYEGEFDAVVAMYHDQGLIPVKLVHFHEAVNVSLGLPIIRASVDHGTAYDLAGTGKARSGSLEAALRLASDMARNRATATC